MFDVCVCVHSPRRQIFKLVVDSLSRQNLPRGEFNVLIVDNASVPPLRPDDEIFDPFREAKVNFAVVREERLGVASARLRAFSESSGTVVFVDDDNVLAANFLETAKQILSVRSEVGCFSGKILLPDHLKPPRWMWPALLGSLAIRDAGEEPIVDWFRGGWPPWVPGATASMVVRREVIEAFIRSHGSRAGFLDFGRKGRNNLMSGEDYLIALSAADAGYKCGYFPELVMHHHIRPSRLRFFYMLRLMWYMAKTDSLRDVFLGLNPAPFRRGEIAERLWSPNLKAVSWRTKICYGFYEFFYVLRRSYRLLKTRQSLNERHKDNA